MKKLLDEKICDLLNELVEDNEIVFNTKARELISDIAKECRELDLYKTTFNKKSYDYAAGFLAADVAYDMFGKIKDAPNKLIMAAVPRLLIPILDDKLKEEYGDDENNR